MAHLLEILRWCATRADCYGFVPNTRECADRFWLASLAGGALRYRKLAALGWIAPVGERASRGYRMTPAGWQRACILLPLRCACGCEFFGAKCPECRGIVGLRGP